MRPLFVSSVRSQVVLLQQKIQWLAILNFTVASAKTKTIIMTIPGTHKPNWTIALGIPFLIFLSCLLITFSRKFNEHNELLSNAILLDLLVTAPFIYFLAIRKSNVSKVTVTRVFITGLLLAGFLLKAHTNPFLQIIKTFISPVIEALVIFIICKKIYIANKNAKTKNTGQVDFLLHSRSILFEILQNEKVANIFSAEVAVLYYAFFSSRDKSVDYKTKFSSYKENGLPIVLGAILSVFLMETTGVHFLLSLWSRTTAWIITGLSLYTCIQLFAHIRAIKARPMRINKDSFEVHNGLAGDAFIQFNNIEKIEVSGKKPFGREAVKISLLKGLENHNVVVYLKEPVDVTKIFGIKKQTNTVLFFVDKPKHFVYTVTSLLTNKGAA